VALANPALIVMGFGLSLSPLFAASIWLSNPYEVGESLKLSRGLVDFLQVRLLLGRDILKKLYGNTFDIESGEEHVAETFRFLITEPSLTLSGRRWA
jgi:hypothetical protein